MALNHRGMERRTVAKLLVALAAAGPYQTLCAAGVDQSATADVLILIIAELVAANHILNSEGILNAFGHISCRHPGEPSHFLMSRSRAPGLIEASDIMAFGPDGTAIDGRGRTPYNERFIHAGIYLARPDVRAVVHDHSPEVIPFGITDVPLRPVSNIGAALGETIPVWDIRTKFGNATNGQVATLAMGKDIAAALGNQRAVLMRGHGAAVTGPSIRLAVAQSISLAAMARVELETLRLGRPINYPTEQEVAAAGRSLDPNAPGGGMARAWEYWCKKAGVPYTERGF